MELEEKKKALILQLIKNGYLKTKRIIDAFKKVPREEFVPERYKEFAYIDEPLPIGFGQTISAPHMVAVMTELLEPKRTDKVLEIGSGSGYQAAVLSRLVNYVYTIEVEAGLYEFAKNNLQRLGYKNIKIIHGDGSKGYPQAKPYDKIIVTCGTEKIYPEWIEQLKRNGVLVAPVGSPWIQTLVVGKKKNKNFVTKKLFRCMFVPLRRV